MPFSDVMPALLGAQREGRSVVVATVAFVRGSMYRRPGARAVLGEHGPLAGIVSGGCLEQDLVLRARAVLAAGQAEIVAYDLANDLDRVFGTGSGCEGSARILLERVLPGEPWPGRVDEALSRRLGGQFETLLEGSFPHRLCPPDEPFASGEPVLREDLVPPLWLVVFGAGDDAQPLVALARAAGFLVTVVDRRAAFARDSRFPGAQVACATEADFARTHPWDPRTAAVVMTHSYDKDREILEALLPGPAFYVGLLGPKRRSKRMLEGMSGAESPRLYAPAGLDLGGETPAEIALAIVSEIRAVHTGRAAISLRDRAGSIHEGVAL